MNRGQKDVRTLTPDELADEQASDLPKREAMTLLDPNALGGAVLSGPSTTGGPTGPTPDPVATTQPAGESAQTAGQTASQGTQLASGYMPDTSEAARGPYQPNASSTATS